MDLMSWILKCTSDIFQQMGFRKSKTHFKRLKTFLNRFFQKSGISITHFGCDTSKCANRLIETRLVHFLNICYSRRSDHQHFCSSKEPIDNWKHTRLMFEWNCPYSAFYSTLQWSYRKPCLFGAVLIGQVMQGPVRCCSGFDGPWGFVERDVKYSQGCISLTSLRWDVYANQTSAHRRL